jgi:putative ATP-dependent endonuclease of OLD family
VRLARVRVEGYRCLDDVELTFDDLTILLGTNSAGKSSILRALQFFFEDGSLTRDDAFGSDDAREIVVQVTFDHLTRADRETFGSYARGDQMVLRRAWKDGKSKLTGRGLQYPAFTEVRGQSGGVARRTAYNQLVTTHPELGLPSVSRVDEADQAMLDWEMAHPDQCATCWDEATRFFGYSGVGRNRINERFKFVFIPGLKDAAEEATERRGTILERLLTAITEQRAEADKQLASLEESVRDQYKELVETTHRTTLQDLASGLQDRLRDYVPTSEVALEPVPQELQITAPRVRMVGGDEQHLTDLGRQGHGFQRAFIIAALEYLATAEAQPEGDPATIFLAIEEPELYQHPPRAAHFAATLRGLATRDRPKVQVCYATHSPYFVEPSRFASIRICRRVKEHDGRPARTVVRAVSESEVARNLPASRRHRFPQEVARTLNTSFREAFFARAVLLVEGPTDVAVFSQLARMLGSEFLSHGVVCAQAAKSVMPIAHGILTSLEIPTFVVFDGDDHKDGNGICATCGRGRGDARHHAKLNRELLISLGEQATDFPKDQHNARWACFRTDLEHHLQEHAQFTKTRSKVAEELNWNAKSGAVYAETIERLGLGALPPMLASITECVLEMART